MRRDLVAVGHSLLREPWREQQGAAAGIERRLGRVALERRPDARPARPGAVGEVALHAQVRHAFDLLDGLVDVLVRRVTMAERQLRPFLHVDNDRHGQTRATGPAHLRRVLAIAAIVPSGPAVAFGHRMPQKSASRFSPTSRSPITSATTASRMRPAEIAAMVGSGLSSTYCSI